MLRLPCFGLQLRARRRDVFGDEEEEGDDADESGDGERTCSPNPHPNPNPNPNSNPNSNPNPNPNPNSNPNFNPNQASARAPRLQVTAQSRRAIVRILF